MQHSRSLICGVLFGWLICGTPALGQPSGVTTVEADNGSKTFVLLNTLQRTSQWARVNTVDESGEPLGWTFSCAHPVATVMYGVGGSREIHVAPRSVAGGIRRIACGL